MKHVWKVRCKVRGLMRIGELNLAEEEVRVSNWHWCILQFQMSKFSFLPVAK